MKSPMYGLMHGFQDPELAQLAAIARRHDATMMYRDWAQELLGATSGSGTALANSTTATSLLAGVANWPKIVFPPDYLVRVGQRLVVMASGIISTVVTSPGTLTLDLRYGATVIANGGAMSLNVNAKTNVPWLLYWELTLQALGTTAQFRHQGEWTSEAVIGSPVPTVGGAGTHMLPNAAPALGTAFDQTASGALDFFATWQTANASNSIQCHQLAAYLSN